MTSIAIKQKVDIFGRGYDELSAALKQIPREMWRRRPSPEQWSVHEIIVHLADSEANGYVRFRKGIAESGAPILAYDQVSWTEKLNYLDQNAEDSLELFKSLRNSTYAILKNLPDSTWQNTVNHPKRGIMTLENLLDLHNDHVSRHVGQIKRTYEQLRIQPDHKNA